MPHIPATMGFPRNGVCNSLTRCAALFGSKASLVALCLTLYPVCPNSGAQPRNVIASPGTSEVCVLSQNWSDDDANWFYGVSQGSKLMPYSWFLRLEQPDSQALFRDANHMRSLGYIPRAAAAQGNPDGLPIGFVRDGTDLGLTCAACHTTEIHFKGKAWLIDGAPTLADIETFQRQLARALEQTLSDTGKFDRFAVGVLGDARPSAAKEQLRTRLREVVNARESFNERNLSRHDAPRFGPGRADAFGAIMNEVTSTFLRLPNNHAPANAPVSYPFIWDTPQHDRVEWNGSARNREFGFHLAGTRHVGALGRNTGEVLGVFGTLDPAGAGMFGLGYPSSVNTDNLIKIEEKVRKLWSPQWPAAFGQINPVDQQLGKRLFAANCASCHDDTFDRASPDRHVTARMAAVGTDPSMAENFAKRRAKTGLLEGRRVKLSAFRRFGPDAPVSAMLTHMVQRAILGAGFQGPLHERVPGGIFVASGPEYRINAELQLDSRNKLSGAFDPSDFVAVHGKVQEIRSPEELRFKKAGKVFSADTSLDSSRHLVMHDGAGGSVDLTKLPNVRTTALQGGGAKVTFDQAVDIWYEYKARPLNGIWATAPYLHNGSVPNLDELLKPSTKRIKKFKVGSREFDAGKVGFVINEGQFEFDTTKPGNSNSGHEYTRVFTADERRELIAYLKSL